jgi:mediator of RNA polymerase II transcription subunit 12
MPRRANLFVPGTADFYPWSPQSPEDILTDALVKGGVNNKPSMINETNTARPSLWSNLKNKSGLQTLSTLLCAVLEKRQQCGRLTAPSTFKPPPRVTLTDSKRETWLRDLANPAIALRRLSRTIPHGIRGKLLLEQCLSKNIPIARAVWLAKCIGSNELRAFKRKGATGTVGMGAELKWNREWTIFVEQFVENTVSSCGQPDWKARMDYA